jgi:ribosome-associated toxin RatA of RatAB toxin-antitoxin module
MSSLVSIDVLAPPELVFRLASDVERWPSLLPHYASVRIDRRTAGRAVVARFVAIRTFGPLLRLGLPVAWRALVWAEPEALRLRFRHLGGPTDGMDVTWRIEPARGGCRVSIEHDFRPRIAPWAPVVDRVFVRPIATRTLAAFKAIAETMSATT